MAQTDEIQHFLTAKFGEEKGNNLYSMQQGRLRRLLQKAQKNHSPAQMKTLEKTILPRVALYQILQETPEKADAYRIVKEYMVDVVCEKSKKQYFEMEQMPFFYDIFRKAFIFITLKSDNWSAELFCREKDKFTIHIHRCLWYSACKDNGCPELCRLLCDCDEINYGGLHKMKFAREGSIGKGQNFCDFTFLRQTKKEKV